MRPLVQDRQRRPQRLALLSDGRLQGLRDGLPFRDAGVRQFEHISQHEPDPVGMDGRILPPPRLVVEGEPATPIWLSRVVAGVLQDRAEGLMPDHY